LVKAHHFLVRVHVFVQAASSSLPPLGTKIKMANGLLDLLKFKFRFQEASPIKKKKSRKSGKNNGKKTKDLSTPTPKNTSGVLSASSPTNNKVKETKDLSTPTPTNTSIALSASSTTSELNHERISLEVLKTGHIDKRTNQPGDLCVQKSPEGRGQRVDLRNKINADLNAHGLSIEAEDEAMIHPAFRGPKGHTFDESEMWDDIPPLTEPPPTNGTRE